MSPLNWKPEMGVAHGELNALRKELVALVNVLGAAVGQGDARAADDALGRLVAYTRHYCSLAEELGLGSAGDRPSRDASLRRLRDLADDLDRKHRRRSLPLAGDDLTEVEDSFRVHLGEPLPAGALVKIPVR